MSMTPVHRRPPRPPARAAVTLFTQEFIKRNGQFTVNVGLCEAGVPILGVVGVPAAEEPRTYFAVKGGGAFVEVSIPHPPRPNENNKKWKSMLCGSKGWVMS